MFSLFRVFVISALARGQKFRIGGQSPLPLYALGLRLDGSVAACLSVLAVVGGGTLAMAFVHGWSPVQRERTLTPNG